ncbi:MAG: glycosyltransferase family 9 protein [Chitinispirillaceae bacterium]|nr:glycosyltransferase family 9 protein [Chitinispirillaceae bacterium]
MTASRQPASTPASGGILIIQTAFIGDTILATVCIENIKKHHPDLPVDLLVRKGNESLFDQHPHIRALYVWNKGGGKYLQLIRLLFTFRRQRYRWCVNLQKHPTTALLSLLSGAQDTAGFTTTKFGRFYSRKVVHRFDPAKGCTHEVDLLLRVSEGAAPVEERVLPRLYPQSADIEAVATTSPYVTIAPASVRFTKQYPAEKWIAAIDLISHDTTVYLLGGASERKLCESIRERSPHPKVINRAGELSFLQSAALMKGAMMNYVNDSAPLHLASSVDAAVTAVFCSTVPAFGFGPLGGNSRIVETEEPLTCRPCGLHGHRACPQGHFRCAAIPPEAVITGR